MCSSQTVKIIDERSGFALDQVVEFTPYRKKDYIYVDNGIVSRPVLKQYVRFIDANGKPI